MSGSRASPPTRLRALSADGALRRLAAAMTIVLTLPCGAAQSADSDWQQWSKGTIKHSFDEHWDFTASAEGRFADDISRSDIVKLESVANYAITQRLRGGLGYAYYDNIGDSHENRLVQQVAYGMEPSGFALGHRGRLEQRFIQGIGGIVVRARYRLGATYPLGVPPWYLAGSNEVFVNLNSKGEGPVDGFEQNRISGALGVHLGVHLRMEAGYMWRYKDQRDKTNRSDHVITVRFFINTSGK